MLDDGDRELESVMSSLVGRPVTTTELVRAMGVSRSGYYIARSAGRLITADHLLPLARAFGLNPIDLMVRFGLLTEQTAIDYVNSLQAATPAAAPARQKRLRRRPDSPPL